MGTRYLDWFRQAQADLQHAHHSLEAGDYEWSCFAAHQAIEHAEEIIEFCRNQID